MCLSTDILQELGLTTLKCSAVLGLHPEELGSQCCCLPNEHPVHTSSHQLTQGSTEQELRHPQKVFLEDNFKHAALPVVCLFFLSRLFPSHKVSLYFLNPVPPRAIFCPLFSLFKQTCQKNPGLKLQELGAKHPDSNCSEHSTRKTGCMQVLARTDAGNPTSHLLLSGKSGI